MRAGRPARTPGEVSEGAGRVWEARKGGAPAWWSRGVPAVSAISGRGLQGPAVRYPHPGPEPEAVADPSPLDAQRWALATARPLFCFPGFRRSLGRRCGEKAASKDAS